MLDAAKAFIVRTTDWRSLALLILAVRAGLDVVAIHVDHGLRPGSDADAEVVAAAAARYGAGFAARSVTVEPGPDLEQ